MNVLGSEKPPAALAENTGFLMNWVANRSRKAFMAALERETGLHPRDYGVLRVIASEPGITQLAVGELAGVDPSTMVATLDGLEARGLAERRPHATDRRKRAVHLTAEGERVVARASEIARAVSREVYGRLTADERQELQRILRKLTGVDAG